MQDIGHDSTKPHTQKPVPAQQSFLVLVKSWQPKVMGSYHICLNLCISPAVNKGSYCFQNLEQNLDACQCAFTATEL